MKIAVIGATGTVGRAVFAELAKRHETFEIGATRGAHRVDLTDIDSIRRLFDSIGRVDAIVAAAGHVHFGPLVDMTPAQFRRGLDDKLMGQVNLVLTARDYLNDGGSFTLTSGIVGAEVILQGASAAAVNGAIEGFVRGAAIELPRGLRINAVSPTMLEEAAESFGPYFRGFEPAPGARVALAYSRSVEGAETGRVYKVH
ncbi:short chain dehydrogenase [Caballeronia terrestris]|jgi:NAD(P)-dependent dehydrogenase (short-subunit alcohol dehydrogenase family)|uniref:Short chain dehydrogenase n=1 Tax=Caballeronia terrestris TaxID=1226301 RepID=A0A158J7E3_9BURK|nr:short chain dehydrogenase [Caballeronia terrestris]SAL64373.1 short chain dehydrogenase [Caballeronia terrestris]